MAATVAVGTDGYRRWTLDLNTLDVEEIATALADQTDYEHRWLIDSRTGESRSGPGTAASTAALPLILMTWT
jgi:hypothetical protein